MGNICGKSSKDDNFQGQGRTLGSAPPLNSNARAKIPSAAGGGGGAAKLVAGGAGRTVGGLEGGDASDPRGAALAAAEARAKKAQGTGKLNQQLTEQKKMSRQETLEQASRENRAQRDADAATEVRNYN